MMSKLPSYVSNLFIYFNINPFVPIPKHKPSPNLFVYIKIKNIFVPIHKPIPNLFENELFLVNERFTVLARV